MNHFFLALVCISLLLTTGCFHDKSKDSNKPTQAPRSKAVITIENAKEVFADAYFATEIDPPASFSFTELDEEMSILADVLVNYFTPSGTKYEYSYDCDVSGKVSGYFEDRDQSKSWTAGDSMQTALEKCVDIEGDEPETLSIVTQFDSAYKRTQVVSGSTFNWSDSTSLVASTIVRKLSGHATVEILGKDDKLQSIEIAASLTFTYDTANNTYRVEGIWYDSLYGEMNITVPGDQLITYYLDETSGYPIVTGGTMIVEGANGGKIVGTISEHGVLLSIDIDGDGVEDKSDSATWAELFALWV